jgi:hypothetical protein
MPSSAAGKYSAVGVPADAVEEAVGWGRQTFDAGRQLNREGKVRGLIMDGGTYRG